MILRPLLPWIAAAVMLTTTPAAAEPAANSSQSAKLADIRKVLELSGSANIGIQIMQQMISSFKASMPQVPEQFWTDFMKQVKPGELADLVVPIYDKHLTHQDVKDLIAFYESPIGRKLVQVQPQITAESMQAGQQWGMKLGQKVAEELQKKGYQ